MSISGITPVASMIPAQSAQVPGQAPGAETEMTLEQASNPGMGMDTVELSSSASTSVLKMANDVFANVAMQLIDSMTATMTGLGQNIDVRA